MTTQLVQQILNHPNSAFSNADAAWLSKTPQDALQRMLLSLESAPATTYNADPTSALREDLTACREDLNHALSEEQRIITELAAYGVAERSILAQKGVQTNNAASLNDEIVREYLTKARTPLTTVVAEGMIARNQTRQKWIDVITQNSDGAFTQQELEAKPAAELHKLVKVVRSQRANSQPSQQWAAAAFADLTPPGVIGTQQYTMNEADMDIDDEPLLPASLWN